MNGGLFGGLFSNYCPECSRRLQQNFQNQLIGHQQQGLGSIGLGLQGALGAQSLAAQIAADEKSRKRYQNKKWIKKHAYLMQEQARAKAVQKRIGVYSGFLQDLYDKVN